MTTDEARKAAHGGGASVEALEEARAATDHRSLRQIVRDLRQSGNTIVSALAIVAALWWARPVLIPLVFSVLISYALEPIVARLAVWRFPRPVAVPLVLTSVIVATALGMYSLRGEAVTLANKLPNAAHMMAQAIRASRRSTSGLAASVRQATQELDSATTVGPQQFTDRRITPVRIEEPTFKWSDWLWQGSWGAIEFGFQLFAVLCLVYYMLVAGDMFKRKLVRIVGPSMTQRKMTLEILAEIERQIQRFLWARLLISAVVGVAFWLVLRLVGLDDAGMWGVLAALLFMIPFAGPAIITASAGVATFLQFESLVTAGAVTAICLAIAAIEGNFLAPWLMSRAGEMNTLAVFVSLMFWGWIWGIWGLLLAVPITASIRAICDRISTLKPVAELLRE